MKAEEAKSLTEKNLAGPVISKYIEYIDMRIKAAALKGKSSIHNPQSGSREEGLYYLLEDERKAVRLHYEQSGFTWTDHEDPDPGHPCSAPYTTLSW